MTHGEQPLSGSLSAKIIRACTKHQNKCGLDCPRRKVEDLGEIASFDTRQITPRKEVSKWLRWFRQ